MNDVWIAGVDEVGRGPLAGDVVAAAVILDPAQPISGLMDSKKLPEKKREQLAIEIKAKALAWSIARASVAEIDEINILHASMLAMKRAVESLAVQPHHVLVDGNRLPKWRYSAEAIVKGDSKIPAISAASILAKVQRDSEMVLLDKQFPGYGLAIHKGYPTAKHLAAIQTLGLGTSGIETQGIVEIYRRSFGPVRRLLERS